MNWFKKTKQSSEPTWKISTKVISEQEPVLLRTRKKKASYNEYLFALKDFFIRYVKTVGWVVLSGLLLTAFIVIFTTPLFSLKSERIEIVLEPEPVFDRAAVIALMRDFIGKNIFRLSTTEIFTTLQSNIRHIQSVEKTLLLPDGIRVKIKSFWPIYRAYIGDEVFLLTRNGQLIVDIPEIETSALHIHNLTSDPNGIQNTTLATTDTFIIQEIEKLWYTVLPNFPIEKLDYYDQEKELHIMSQWTRFIFSLSGGMDQLRTISTLIKQGQLTPNRFLYIDVRVPKKMYTCPRDEAQCVLNLRNIYDL